jgi:hypothetical protein
MVLRFEDPAFTQERHLGGLRDGNVPGLCERPKAGHVGPGEASEAASAEAAAATDYCSSFNVRLNHSVHCADIWV